MDFFLFAEEAVLKLVLENLISAWFQGDTGKFRFWLSSAQFQKLKSKLRKLVLGMGDSMDLVRTAETEVIITIGTQCYGWKT